MFFSKWIFLSLFCNFANSRNLSEIKFIQKPRAYYVSPFGSDHNDGSKRFPLKTLDRVNELTLHARDSVLFEGGRSFHGTLRFNAVAGDSRFRIVISSYGNGYASIMAGNEQGIVLRGSSWIVLKKLKLAGSGRKTGNHYNGIAIADCNHVFAEDLNISGFQKSGLSIDSSHDISVVRVTAHENGYAGISVGRTSVDKNLNRNIYIGYCSAENNPGDPTNLVNHSGNGIVVSACTKVLIEYCTATGNGWDMPRQGNGPVGIWAFEADSVIIQHCLSYRNKTSPGAADGGGFDFDGGVTNSVVQYCLSYENQGAGYCIFQYLYASPWHDNIFRFNISKNDGLVSDARAGMYIWNSSKDSSLFYNCFAYNNTIYNSREAAINYSELSERHKFFFYNNIFIARDSLVLGSKGNDLFLGNVWSSLKNRNKSVPVFSNSGKLMPLTATGLKTFRNYRLPMGSALRQKGIYLKTDAGIDTDGINFNETKTPDLGVGASF